MDKVSPELTREVLRLMIQDGVTLTGDLNQCERAVGAWVRKVGAASIEAHLAGEKTAMKDRVGGVGAGLHNDS
jgi:hypothetical protein